MASDAKKSKGRVKFAFETCCNCGIRFAMPQELQDYRRKDGKTFHCPNGHGQHYKQPTEEEKKASLEAVKKQLEERTAEVEKLKGDILRVKHEAEQAEAKKS